MRLFLISCLSFALQYACAQSKFPQPTESYDLHMKTNEVVALGVQAIGKPAGKKLRSPLNNAYTYAQTYKLNFKGELLVLNCKGNSTINMALFSTNGDTNYVKPHKFYSPEKASGKFLSYSSYKDLPDGEYLIYIYYTQPNPRSFGFRLTMGSMENKLYNPPYNDPTTLKQDLDILLKHRPSGFHLMKLAVKDEVLPFSRTWFTGIGRGIGSGNAFFEYHIASENYLKLLLGMSTSKTSIKEKLLAKAKEIHAALGEGWTYEDNGDTIILKPKTKRPFIFPHDHPGEERFEFTIEENKYYSFDVVMKYF